MDDSQYYSPPEPVEIPDSADRLTPFTRDEFYQILKDAIDNVSINDYFDRIPEVIADRIADDLFDLTRDKILQFVKDKTRLIKQFNEVE